MNALLGYTAGLVTGATFGVWAGPAIYHRRLKAYMRRVQAREALSHQELADRIAEVDT